MNSRTSKSNTTLATPRNPDLPTLDYRALFHVLPDRYIIFRADDPDFTFVEVSKGHSDMTGVSRENIIGRPFFDVFPDVSEKYKRTGVSEMAEAFRRVIRTKSPQVFSVIRYDIADDNGDFVEKYWRPAHYPLFDKAGKVAFIVQSSYDVTEELSVAQMLRDTQAQLEDALSFGKVGSWLWDVERDVVVVGRTLADMFGVDPDEAAIGLPTHDYFAFIHPDDRKRVLTETNKAIRSGTGFESEYRIISQAGRMHWVLARGHLEIGKGGQTARFSGVVVDMTERHNFERQIEEARIRDELIRRESSLLQKRNKELETLSRTKDEFVALASHQLRTPATAVKQYLGMVLQGYAGTISEVQTDMLDRAFQSNERQIQIINQILNAARVDTGRLVMTPAPLDLYAQLQGIVEEMRQAIEQKGHVLHARLGTKPAKVYADAGYLRMALENIIHNASIYTPSPGSIEVTMRRLAKHVEISISDNGVGIKQSDVKKLFTKFTRIHNPLSVEAGGSGIGLYLTAEIVRLHGGTITVDSKIRKGTTFVVRLPLLAT